MRILVITNTDNGGRRFNGIELAERLRQCGHHVDVLVWEKTDKKGTWRLIAPFRFRGVLKLLFDKIERNFGLQSILHLYWGEVLLRSEFWRADVVHLHLIHTSPFSLLLLPLVSLLKPTVWTLHDPWAFTGHCIHPFDCDRWKAGCGRCPRLETPLAVRVDRTRLMWAVKRICYRLSRCAYIMSSNWMERIFASSPLMRGFRQYIIPFGLNLEVFQPTDKEQAKAALGIPDGCIVVGFRSVLSPYKGLEDAKYVIAKIRQAGVAVAVLTFDQKGNLHDLEKGVPIFELGWIEQSETIAAAYNAVDVFLMPSTAESFGMMAVEAMACGVPVVCYSGTATRNVINAPIGGISVAYRDRDALYASTKRLIDDANARRVLGMQARALCEKQYSERDYVRKTEDAYQREISHRRRRQSAKDF